MLNIVGVAGGSWEVGGEPGGVPDGIDRSPGATSVPGGRGWKGVTLGGASIGEAGEVAPGLINGLQALREDTINQMVIIQR